MQNLINKIHYANCFDVLAQIPDNSIDLVLTDPPYLTTKLEYDVLAAKTLNLNKWFAEIIRVAKPTAPILIFSSGKFTYKMVNIGEKYFRYEMIWHKINKCTGGLDSNVKPMLNHEFILYFMLNHEFILYFSKRFMRSSNKSNAYNTYNHGVIVDKNVIKISKNKRRYTTHHNKDYPHKEYKKLNNKKYPKSILHYPVQINKRIHPNQKPDMLISYLINTYSNENDIVLDTFSGSGVVAKSCIENKRNFIATELDLKYYENSIKNIYNNLFTNHYFYS